MTRTMTVAEYAHHRQVTEQAVRYAIKTGRIERLPDGQIDVEAADARWAIDRTTQSRIRDGHARRARMKQDRQAAPQVEDGAESTTVEIPEETKEVAPTVANMLLNKQLSNLDPVIARTIGDVLRAELNAMRIHRETKRLVSRDRVERAVAQLARAFRDSWTAWASETAIRIADKLKVDELRLEHELRIAVIEQLNSLADMSLGLADDE